MFLFVSRPDEFRGITGFTGTKVLVPFRSRGKFYNVFY